MTESEAKKEIEHNVFCNTDNFKMTISKECYKTIINALEKQMPKKLINTCQYVSGCCPNCKKYISDWLEYNEFMCCPYCGQKLDWNE